ncbi:MAG: hypothetical protein M3377_01340 [Actinomycetota bacterium]|nr:hypothetical protein [Actinomycetota bacterium]
MAGKESVRSAVVFDRDSGWIEAVKLVLERIDSESLQPRRSRGARWSSWLDSTRTSPWSRRI